MALVVFSPSRSGPQEALHPFERLALSVSSFFSTLEADEADEAVARALEEVGTTFGVDECTFVSYGDRGTVRVVRSWAQSPHTPCTDEDVASMPWETTKFPGIAIKVLYSDDSGITTALFRLDPGAVVPLHEHTALEQTYVLEGTIEDHEGVCGPGQFVWRPAGNQHEAVSPNGAVILGFFLKPNRFAYGEKFFTEEAAT